MPTRGCRSSSGTWARGCPTASGGSTTATPGPGSRRATRRRKSSASTSRTISISPRRATSAPRRSSTPCSRSAPTGSCSPPTGRSRISTTPPTGSTRRPSARPTGARSAATTPCGSSGSACEAAAEELALLARVARADDAQVVGAVVHRDDLFVADEEGHRVEALELALAVLVVDPHARGPAVLAIAQRRLALEQLLRLAAAVLDDRLLRVGEPDVEVALDLLAPPRGLRPVVDRGHLFASYRRVAAGQGGEHACCDQLFHSGFTPASLTTLAYFATPSLIMAASSAGVLVSGSAPFLSSVSAVSRALTAAITSLFSRSITAAGVPAGAMSASHSEASKPG